MLSMPLPSCVPVLGACGSIGVEERVPLEVGLAQPGRLLVQRFLQLLLQLALLLLADQPEGAARAQTEAGGHQTEPEGPAQFGVVVLPAGVVRVAQPHQHQQHHRQEACGEKMI